MDWALDAGQEAPVFAKKADANIVFGAETH
jgi:hypothetical protein